MAIKKRRFFRKKVKKRKYNKFFSYKNDERSKRTFLYKNFAKSNSYNTRFTLSNFKYVNFYKSNMKFCGFNGANFDGTEFKHANLKGSRFKGASFKDVIFLNTKLDKTVFKDATFKNVIFIGSSLKRARGITKSTPGIAIYESMPNILLSEKLKIAIRDALINTFIKESEVICFKKKKRLHTINIIKLLNRFTEEQLIIGLKKAQEKITKQFYTLSYLISFIER